MDGGAWWATVHGVTESRTRLSDFTFTFHSYALEKEMATHSSVLALRIPGTGEPGGLPSMGSHRVGHDWSNLAAVISLRDSPIAQLVKNPPAMLETPSSIPGSRRSTGEGIGYKTFALTLDTVKYFINYLLKRSLFAAAAAKSLQLCPTLCDPIDGSPPGSPVPGILKARTLKWVAISFSNA